MTVHSFFASFSFNVLVMLLFCVYLSEGFWWFDDKKVDGKWSEWSSFSSCQLQGDFPYRFRHRNCTNPAPKDGGKQCTGQARRNAPCIDCDGPLGFESRKIKDVQVTASTSHEEFPPASARLNGPSAWCAGDLTAVRELYLQVDLKGLTLVTAIATQGFFPDPKTISLRLGSVSKYQVTFSDDGTKWDVYENRNKNPTFSGNGKNVKTVLNTLNPNIAARYVRIHPTSFFTFVCMKVELYGCRFKCGGYLPNSPGELLAVSSASENVDCLWQAHLPKSKKITFDFINFNLPCKMGHLEIKGDGPSYGGAQVLGHLCDYAAAPPPIEADGNKMWIRFQSNSSDPLVGIYGTYFPNCDSWLNSSNGALNSPNYPNTYNHNSMCSWIITVSVTKAIMLVFADFEVEKDSDGPACKNDHVTVFEGNSSETKIGQFCNSNKPPRYICSRGNRMEVQFKSDDAVALKGFQASYKAKELNAPCTEPSTSIITPSPSFSIPITISTFNSTSVFAIDPTATILATPFVNSSLAPLFPGTKVPRHIYSGDDDDDEDNGMTTIIIISVFSFIVLCMVIASIIPSMVHGYEKRKRERECSLAAADLVALKKTNCAVANEYEMQPLMNDKIENTEFKEETLCLDREAPVDGQAPDDVTPCLPIIPEANDDDDDPDVHGSVQGSMNECDLEYDPTDLNLHVSYEDLSSSFATEMAALMSNYETLSPSKGNREEENEASPTLDNDAGSPKDEICNDDTSNNNNKDPPVLSTLENQEADELETNDDSIQEPSNTNSNTKGHDEPDDIESAEVLSNVEDEKLQNALSGLKATLSQVHSDSGSISEIENPDTNSTVSARGSQDIDNLPSVDVVNPMWERKPTQASDCGSSKQQQPLSDQMEDTDQKLDENSKSCSGASSSETVPISADMCSSGSDNVRVPLVHEDVSSGLGTETIV